MRKVIIDVCNTLFNVNEQIERMTGIIRPSGSYRFPGLDREWFDSHLDVFRSARVMDGSVDYVSHLKKRYEIVYMSARPESARSITMQRLNQSGFPEGMLILTNKPKGEICSQISGDIAFAIDDAPEEIRSYIRANIFCAVPAWDYNTEFMGRFVYRKKENVVCNRM